MVQKRREGRFPLYSCTQWCTLSDQMSATHFRVLMPSRDTILQLEYLGLEKKVLVSQGKQKTDSLPATSESLFHHLKRSNYQTFVWKHSLEAELSLTSPAVNSWKLQVENLEAVLMSSLQCTNARWRGARGPTFILV